MADEEMRSTLRSSKRAPNPRRSSLTSTLLSPETDASFHRHQRTVQNFSLVWLDPSTDESDVNFHDIVTHLVGVVNTHHIYNNIDRCISFLRQATHENIMMVVSGFAGESVMPSIHDMSHVYLIYVLCVNVSRHELWAKKWVKVKGVFAEVNSICKEAKQSLMNLGFTRISLDVSSEGDYPSFGFLALDEDVTNADLNALDHSFMITQVLKEILFELEYDKHSVAELATFCREMYRDNKVELNIIDEFENEYESHNSIWWYTRECFTYKMLNRALRNSEVNTIIKMGFFLRDLHREVVGLHAEQNLEQSGSRRFTVYRGQQMSREDFEQLRKTEGGLISFNNFLSTSLSREVAVKFTEALNTTGDFVGILFVISIDPSVTTTPFARVDKVGYYREEVEMLFSMHSVFRIGSIQLMNNRSDCKFEVSLRIVDEQDQQLHGMNERLRKETKGSSGSDRVGKLLIKLGKFHNAEKTYKVLLHLTTDDVEKAHFYHQLGYIKEDLAEYDEALSFYENSLEIKTKILSSDHSDIAMYYNNVGSVYDKKGEYLTSISFFKKAIHIYESTLSMNHPWLASCYNNIGSTFRSLTEYSTALSFFEKALEIDQKTMLSCDPLLAVSYNNIGLLYDDMQEHSEAIKYYKKTLTIYRKALSSDHPDFSVVYSNIASAYSSMHQYSEALLYYGKALEIDEKTFSPNHPFLGISHHNIGSVHKNMGHLSEALASFEKALTIESSTQSPNYARIQQYTNKIESVLTLL